MRLFGEVLVTMLVILDPPGNVPIFLAVTQRLSDKERHRAAFLAVGTAFFVISLFAVGGRTVLDYLRVSVPALQGAGPAGQARCPARRLRSCDGRPAAGALPDPRRRPLPGGGRGARDRRVRLPLAALRQGRNCDAALGPSGGLAVTWARTGRAGAGDERRGHGQGPHPGGG